MIKDDERLQILLDLIKPLRVLLVEHDLKLRRAIRDTIASDSAFELAAECASRNDALQIIERTPLDIVLVSLKLPDGSGLDVVRAAKRFLPLSEVLVMGTAENKEDMRLSLKAGASTCLMKESFIRGKISTGDLFKYRHLDPV